MKLIIFLIIIILLGLYVTQSGHIGWQQIKTYSESQLETTVEDFKLEEAVSIPLTPPNFPQIPQPTRPPVYTSTTTSS